MLTVEYAKGMITLASPQTMGMMSTRVELDNTSEGVLFLFCFSPGWQRDFHSVEGGFEWGVGERTATSAVWIWTKA